jgi:hypothetical protein
MFKRNPSVRCTRYFNFYDLLQYSSSANAGQILLPLVPEDNVLRHVSEETEEVLETLGQKSLYPH